MLTHWKIDVYAVKRETENKRCRSKNGCLESDESSDERRDTGQCGGKQKRSQLRRHKHSLSGFTRVTCVNSSKYSESESSSLDNNGPNGSATNFINEVTDVTGRMQILRREVVSDDDAVERLDMDLESDKETSVENVNAVAVLSVNETDSSRLVPSIGVRNSVASKMLGNETEAESVDMDLESDKETSVENVNAVAVLNVTETDSSSLVPSIGVRNSVTSKILGSETEAESVDMDLESDKETNARDVSVVATEEITGSSNLVSTVGTSDTLGDETEAGSVAMELETDEETTEKG